MFSPFFHYLLLFMFFLCFLCNVYSCFAFFNCLEVAGVTKHFYYCFSQVPVPVAKMNSTEHPVKVGLSDAFMALLSSQPSGQFPTQWFLHQTCRISES